MHTDMRNGRMIIGLVGATFMLIVLTLLFFRLIDPNHEEQVTAARKSYWKIEAHGIIPQLDASSGAVLT